MHCMSGISFGCIVWCPSAFTNLPGLESFPLGSNGLFHVFIPPPGFTTPTVWPSCATHLLSCLEQSSLDVVPDILSGPIRYTCRCAHMLVEDLLEMIACLRVFQIRGVNLRLDFGGTSVLMSLQEADVERYFLARDHFYICDKFCAWSYGTGWSLSAWLCSQLARDEMAVTFLETCVLKK